MSGEIINVLNALCEKFGIVVDWTSENILPEIKTISEHYISFEISSSIMFLVLGGLLLLIGLLIVWSAFSEVAEDYSISCELLFLGVVIIATSGLLICCQTYDIILCNTFPEKLLLDYVTTSLTT